MAGHLSVSKTYDRVLHHFFWPHLKRDVTRSCKTCNICQFTRKPNQQIKPAPLYPISVVEKPFEYLLLDCVCPLPKSKNGSKYLLTVICKSTRYPAAFPLRSIKAKPILRTLTSFITTFGVAKIIKTDQGSNFILCIFSSGETTEG